MQGTEKRSTGETRTQEEASNQAITDTADIVYFSVIRAFSFFL